MNYENFLNEVISKFPKFKVGMRFEVLNPIYENKTLLATSAKDKINTNTLKEYITSKKLKGDILICKEINNHKAICENMDTGKTVCVTAKDLLENNIKIIQRLRK